MKDQINTLKEIYTTMNSIGIFGNENIKHFAQCIAKLEVVINELRKLEAQQEKESKEKEE